MAKQQGLRYDQLFQVWLAARNRGAPAGQRTPPQVRGAPPPIFLSGDEATAYRNAVTPEELYLRPNYTPHYGTAGFTERELTELDKLAIALISQPSTLPLRSYFPVTDVHPEWSATMAPHQASAVYGHESGHFFDPRLRPYALSNVVNNQGYLMRGGQPQQFISGELPGFEGESALLRALLGR